jgi:hypothetical protein
MTRAFYLILFGCLIIVGYIKYLENKGIFFPQKGIEFYPSSVNIAFEDVYLKTEDKAKINGWFIPHNNAEYTLLFLHGNAGNIGHRLEKLLILRNAGVNIFIIDYRGYGKSQGNISEKGFYRDAKAAYDYLINDRSILPGQIIVYGESIGTAAVIDLAAKAKVRAVILEGAFSRGKDVANKFYPFLPAFIFSDTFNSLKKIKNIRVPKLFIHSRDDEILPFELADKLYKASPEPKEMVMIGGSHNTAFLDSREKYISSIKSFIEKLDRRQI